MAQSLSSPGCKSLGMPQDHWAALYTLRSQVLVREPIYKVVPQEHGRCALACLACFDRSCPDKKPFLLYSDDEVNKHLVSLHHKEYRTRYYKEYSGHVEKNGGDIAFWERVYAGEPQPMGAFEIGGVRPKDPITQQDVVLPRSISEPVEPGQQEAAYSECQLQAAKVTRLLETAIISAKSSFELLEIPIGASKRCIRQRFKEWSDKNR